MSQRNEPYWSAAKFNLDGDMSTENLGKFSYGNPGLLTEQEAAEYLKISPGTLSVWRSTGRYALPFVKVGHKVRYRLADLNSWINSRERASGATA